MAAHLVSGGTGFVGRPLVRLLKARGDSVSVLTRDAARVRKTFGDGVDALSWPPDPIQLGEFDSVVNLAGEQAVGVRYTASVKRRIRDSRVGATRTLVEALSLLPPRPRVFVCFAGVGYYGTRLDALPLDEQSAPGRDFLAEVVKELEATAQQAESFGTRVVRIRSGMVLGSEGGALPTMSRPFKLGVGGPMGSGEQMISWIHLDDAIAILVRCLDDPSISGPINVVAPEAVRQADFASAIGRALRRPAAVRVPAFALRLVFGEGAVPILTGQNAVPAVLRSIGYKWRFPSLDQALAQIVGTTR